MVDSISASSTSKYSSTITTPLLVDWAGMLLENYSSFICPCIHIEERTLYIAKTIKERKKDQEQVREKSFHEMKKDVGMTTAQKSKETRRMEMGSIFVLYIQTTIPTHTYVG